MISYFTHLTVILFCFTFHSSYSVSDPVDLINFNVYQNGTKTYGHLKIPSLHIKSDFFLHQRNATHILFDIFSKDPYRLVIGGSLSSEQQADGVAFKGRLTSLTHPFTVKLDSIISFMNNTGHNLESKIDFDVPNTINGSYLFNFSAKPYHHPCFPVSFSHNLTTYPPDLIDFDSGFKGSCLNGNTNVDLDLSLKSNQFSWLNTDLKQFWIYNSTGGYESMNATLQSYDIDVIANWTKAPLVKEFKMANFRSKSDKLPSFRIKYMVDGDDKKMLYEKI